MLQINKLALIHSDIYIFMDVISFYRVLCFTKNILEIFQHSSCHVVESQNWWQRNISQEHPEVMLLSWNHTVTKAALKSC